MYTYIYTYVYIYKVTYIYTHTYIYIYYKTLKHGEIWGYNLQSWISPLKLFLGGGYGDPISSAPVKILSM